MFLALIAVPHVVLVQDLVLLELLEAVVDGDHPGFGIGVFSFLVDSLGFVTARELLLEALREVLLVHNVQNDVVLPSVVVVEADVVLGTNLVEQIQ